MTSAHATALVAAAWLAGCAAAPPPRATSSLRLRGGVPDALVTIDDVVVGDLATVSRRGVALPPGRHRVTVERAGRFPWDKLVDAEGAPIELDVVLAELPE